MKIALFGPSGSGKTTLAKKIAADHGLIFIPGSSFSKLLTESQKKDLRALGYKETGHREVIALSHTNPKFGMLFQQYVLQQRADMLSRERMFVTDRSPVDNLTYYFLQNLSHEELQENVNNFINSTRVAYQELTHSIFVPLVTNQPSIEANGSRVDSRYFQHMVSAVFSHIFEEYFTESQMPHLTIDGWDFEYRVSQVNTFIEANPF
jgi:predicted ATPase